MPRRRRVLAALLTLGVAAVASGASSATVGSATGDLPVSSPSGKEIAFVVPSQSGFRVEVMAPSGAGRRVVASFARTGFAAELRWAGPHRLIVSIDPNGEIRSINVATGGWRDLSCPGGLGSGCGPLSLGADDNFAVSADGRQVAYTADSPYQKQNANAQGFLSDPLAIGVVAATGGNGRLLPQPINASDAYPSFSPNGRQLVFMRSLLSGGTSSAPSLMIQSVTGGPARSLNIQGQRPAWSPDGRWIAYQALPYGPQGLVPSQLEITAPSGGSRHSLWTPPRHVGLSFSWSPDSTRIAFITESGEMGTVSLTNKATIFKLRPHLIVSRNSVAGVPDDPPHWSLDGETLLFAAAPSSDRKDIHAYAIGVDGRGLHRLDVQR